MQRKSVLRNVLLVIVLVISMVASPASIAYMAPITPDPGFPVLVLTASEAAGNWSLAGPNQLSLTSKAVDLLVFDLLDIEGISVEVQQLFDSIKELGIKSLSVEKNNQTVVVRADNVSVIELLLDDNAISLVSKAYPEVEVFVSLARLVSHFAVVVELPGASAATFTSKLAPAATTVNKVDVGMTMSTGGNLVSIGGVPMSAITPYVGDLGTIEMPFDVKAAGITKAEVSLQGTRLALAVNGAQWANIAVDPAAVDKYLPVFSYWAGYPFGSFETSVMKMAQVVAKDTSVKVAINFADKPMEGSPSLALSKPINVLFDNGEINVAYGGVSLDTGYSDQSVADMMSGVSLTWDGKNRALLSSAVGKQFPYVIDNGLVSEVLSLFDPGLPNADAILGASGFSVNFLNSGDKEPAPLTYTPVKRETVLIRINETLSVDSSGNIAVDILGSPERISGLLDMAGINPAEVLVPYLPVGNNMFTFSVLPDGIVLDLNGKQAQVIWDDATLSYALQTAGPLMDDFGLPTQIKPLLYGILSANKNAWTIQIKSVDKVEPGFIDWILNQTGGIGN